MAPTRTGIAGRTQPAGQREGEAPPTTQPAPPPTQPGSEPAASLSLGQQQVRHIRVRRPDQGRTDMRWAGQRLGGGGVSTKARDVQGAPAEGGGGKGLGEAGRVGSHPVQRASESRAATSSSCSPRSPGQSMRPPCPGHPFPAGAKFAPHRLTVGPVLTLLPGACIPPGSLHHSRKTASLPEAGRDAGSGSLAYLMHSVIVLVSPGRFRSSRA